MTQLALSEQEFSLLRILLEDWCGILVDERKSYLIESRLGTYATELGCGSFSEFYTKIKHSADPTIRDRVIDLMTTNETLWFRDSHPFEILKDVLLPTFKQEIREGKRNKIRIWSSAASTGQEAYSTAMVLLDAMRLSPELRQCPVEILATDISSTALRLAMLGRYDKIAMARGLGEAYQDRYFTNSGRVWSIAPEVRKMVTLKKFNLQESFAQWGKFDIVFCRNVAIYFSDDFKRNLFRKIAGALHPQGTLFLGASESISAYSLDYKIVEHKRGVYYRLNK
jgi:chemotaxis protein methyltransferase CheR